MDFVWPDGWYAAVEGDAALAVELRREVGSRHVLRDIDVRVLARRHDCGDVLFELADGRIAEVHLTWTGSLDPDPTFPWTSLFPSLADWIDSLEEESGGAP